MAFPQTLGTLGTDTDVPTNCDQHFMGASTMNCARGQDSWTNSFNLGDGLLVGFNVGYAWENYRFEIEYLQRGHKGETLPLGLQTGGKNDEFVTTQEKISDVSADHLFANAYYDFYGVSEEFIPYVGVGAGWMRAEMDYFAIFLRNLNRDALMMAGTNVEAAGTLTSADAELSDTLFGYQFVAGFDYELQEDLYIGVKAYYTEFGGEDFSESNRWDLLRGHASTIAPGGDVVEYTIETDDLNFWGLSVNLKYFF